MTEEVILEILKWIVLLILMWLYFSMMSSAQDSAQSEQRQARGSGGSSRGRHPDDYERKSWEEMQRRLKEQKSQESQKKAEKLKEILRRYPEMSDVISKAAGKGDLPARRMLEDFELLEEIASKFSNEVLDMFEVAGKFSDFDVDVDSGHELEEVNAGGQYIEISRMKNPGDIRSRRRSEYGHTIQEQVRRMHSGEAQITKRFNLVSVKKLLYVLEDGSGSMDELMADGKRRFAWARGIILKLLKRAMGTGSRFVYRQFAGSPGSLISVRTSREIVEFSQYLARIGSSGGGTYILGAIQKAVSDIRSSEFDITEADILLISDGQDGSTSNVDVIREMLGDDIKLHVICIGGSNEDLKQIATTYYEVQ